MKVLSNESSMEQKIMERKFHGPIGPTITGSELAPGVKRL